MLDLLDELDRMPRPFNWGTISNESAFGTGYYTRSAIAKSNVFVKSPSQTKYYYLGP